MRAQILALAANPAPHGHHQMDLAEIMVNRLDLNVKYAEKLREIYRNSAIEKRHTVLDGYFGKEHGRFFCKETLPRMRERNELYKKNALPLGAAVGRSILEKSKEDPSRLTHIISVSCTGIFAPGLEFSLIKELGLAPSIERIGLNMMGCFGAFRGLAVAASIALANPNNRILLICTELCSLHFLPTLSWENIVANALFSDGAAAALIGTGSKDPKYEIVRTGAMAIPNSFEEMQWEAGDEALLMKLSPKVPSCLKAVAPAFTQKLLDGVSTANCDFPIHPGGKAILENMEECLGLAREQTQPSWNVLKGFGNMSSATFLFVLNELLESKKHPQKNPKKNPKNHPWAVGLGFGPGLSLEGILLAQ